MLQIIRRLLIRPQCFRLGRYTPVGTSTRGSSKPLQGTHNNIAERSLRGIALGRRNWLFVGSPQGGQTAAILFSVLASCKRHEVEPWAYLRDVLQRLALPATPEELRQLFPHRWKPNPGTK
ncbi:MAG: transposase domain-containing protein [Gemmatales bacterium]